MPCDAARPRLSRATPLLPLLLLLLLPARAAYAQSPLPPPSPAPNVTELIAPPNATTLFGLPASHEPSLDKLRVPAGALLAELPALESRLVAALQDEQSATPTCNQRDANPWPWRVAIDAYVGQRGWGLLDRTCITDVLSSSASAFGKRGATRLFQRVDAFSSALSAHAANFVAPSRRALPPRMRVQWANATRFNLQQDLLSNQRCVRDYAFFVKRGGTWFVSASVTNTHPLLTVPSPRRSYIGAYFDSELRALPMMLPTLESAQWSEWRPHGWQRADAFVSEGEGAAGGAELVPTTARENAAVQLALQSGAHAVERASDALTVSNSAILMLPLVFNAIPVALIAEVNTLGMLVYTLLTDVLTAVPLLVKGVEVVVVGGQNTYAAVMRVTGANLDVEGDHNKAAELFVARCSPERPFRGVGVALIVVALVFMVGGVLAEFAAMGWRKRRMKAMVVQPVDDKQNATYLWVANAKGDAGGKSE